MQIFVSAGEPSGDLHGSNLIRALQSCAPEVVCTGFGGSRMQAAECQLLFPLAAQPVMWFGDAIAHAVSFVRLLRQADEHFRDNRPDAVVLIDYPGFHWCLARRAHRLGIPVFYFVPPQIWAWAGWRVRKMRRYVGHVLCTLPFEEQWYQARGIDAHYVGHPYFDELKSKQIDAEFISEQQRQPGRIVAILPGSRMQELQYNLSTQLRAAKILHGTFPDLRFVVAAFNEAQRAFVLESAQSQQIPLEAHTKQTAEIIQLATACMAVSGSVSLELLNGLVPSTVVYRVHRVGWLMSRCLKTSPWISLVNLLANEELFPEYLSRTCPAERMAADMASWLGEEGSGRQLREKLRRLREKVARPGACHRAANYILEHSRRSTAAKVA